jgi:dihydrofolate reductase
MRKIVSFVHLSLDGFVASADGGLGWVTINEELFGYVEQRIMKTDTALYGRKTFQMMEAYWPTAADKPDASRHDIDHSRWYGQASKIVLSRTLKTGSDSKTKIINGQLAEEIKQIKQSPGSEILVFGSPSTTHALMAEDLIDEYWIFLNPVLLGQGIPLFKNIGQRAALTLYASKVFDSGVVCLQYERKSD